MSVSTTVGWLFTLYSYSMRKTCVPTGCFTLEITKSMLTQCWSVDVLFGELSNLNRDAVEWDERGWTVWRSYLWNSEKIDTFAWSLLWQMVGKLTPTQPVFLWPIHKSHRSTSQPSSQQIAPICERVSLRYTDLVTSVRHIYCVHIQFTFSEPGVTVTLCYLAPLRNM